MELNYYYWSFKSAVPERICDEIVKYGNSKEEKIAIVGGSKKLDKKGLKDLRKKRNSNVVWLSDRWIYEEIQPYIHAANQNAGWKFNWDWSESCQFTKYKKGQYYGWHIDSWKRPYERKDTNDPSHGKIRKLSVTVSLSDPNTYKGGELEFDFRNKDNSTDGVSNIERCKEIKTKGSIVVFPSHLWHRVTPVTKGIRYSLVIWNLGEPFK